MGQRDIDSYREIERQRYIDIKTERQRFKDIER